MTAKEYYANRDLLVPHIMHDIPLIKFNLKDKGGYNYHGLNLHPAMTKWEDQTLAEYLACHALDTAYDALGIAVDEHE